MTTTTTTVTTRTMEVQGSTVDVRDLQAFLRGALPDAVVQVTATPRQQDGPNSESPGRLRFRLTITGD